MIKFVKVYESEAHSNPILYLVMVFFRASFWVKRHEPSIGDCELEQ